MISCSAMADPTRRRILELLARGDCPVGRIVGEFDLSAPAISQHLKILREAELVTVRVEGQRRVYFLHPAGFAELQAWLMRHVPAETPAIPAVVPQPGHRPGPKPAPARTPATREVAPTEVRWEVNLMENP
jgi:DNA-binding transcriptional ArsR family regulator